MTLDCLLKQPPSEGIGEAPLQDLGLPRMMAWVTLAQAGRDVAGARGFLAMFCGVDPVVAGRMVPVLRQRATEVAHEIDRLSDADDSASVEVREEVCERARTFANEVLDAYQGMLVRRRGGFDNGLCAVAERLLDEVAHAHPEWRGLPVILGPEDSYRNESSLVRLRFPTESLWGLPLVTHEQGHHVAFRLTQLVGRGLHQTERLPVMDLKRQEEVEFGSVSASSHLVEIFADIYATWVHGPAYPAALMAFRLDPLEAYSSSFQHPSPESRVRATLKTLQRMDDADTVAPSFQKQIRRLTSNWEGATVSASSRAFRSVPDFQTADRHLDALLNLCERHAGDARFDPSRAAAWMTRLESKQPIEAVATDRIIDVVSAMWRIRSWKRPDARTQTELTVRAVAACEDILEASGGREV